jgi:hypothetical protein
MNSVNAMHEKWLGIASPTRQEVETLIGRTADDISPGAIPGQFEATYRWKGVFRTHALRAKYSKQGRNFRNPRTEPAPGKEAVETLDWISDALE